MLSSSLSSMGSSSNSTSCPYKSKMVNEIVDSRPAEFKCNLPIKNKKIVFHVFFKDRSLPMFDE